jgi:hypothetical protein
MGPCAGHADVHVCPCIQQDAFGLEEMVTFGIKQEERGGDVVLLE